MSADETVPRLADLLVAVEDIMARYVVFRSPAQRVAVALWVLHAHAFGAFDVTGYLNTNSSEPRSGKSRLLEVLEGLVPRSCLVVEVTEAALFRTIERDHPTLLLDEVDALFGKGLDTPRKEALRAILNSGYRRGAKVRRVGGKNRDELIDFDTFGPKVLSGIGELPSTLADRSIPIRLQRRKASEHLEKFRPRQFAQDVAPLRAALAVWAEVMVPVLRAAEPQVPESLNDRAGEAWEPLLAIADLAGQGYPERARTAAVELHAGERAAESVGVLLLAAIREVFASKAAERLLTSDLLAALIDREHEPWGAWWGRDVRAGEPARGPAARLAQLLKPFGIIPTTLRTSTERGKGYYLAAFADAFERYLLPPTAESTVSDVTTGQLLSPNGCHEFLGRDNGSPQPQDVTPQTLAAQGVSRCHDLGSQLGGVGTANDDQAREQGEL